MCFLCVTLWNSCSTKLHKECTKNHKDKRMSDQKNNTNSSLSVSKGVKSSDSINPVNRNKFKNRHKLLAWDEDKYFEEIRNGSRSALSRTLTLIESTKEEHRSLAQKVIEKCLPHSGNSIRIGITGVPGVGKSTFIESLGNLVTKQGKKLAVLTVDPSSTHSKGSILGDKVRMETLANNPNAFIRPSPTAGSLGGVTRKTQEMILLCETAGYDTILVETVGVGQSETAIHSMVDFFLLLMLAGAGDELQGIKRGIIEMADLLAINKTDSISKKLVQQAKREYKNALHLYPATESGWKPRVTTCSAIEETGIKEIWELIEDYVSTTKKNGYFKANRNRQAKHWIYETIHHRLKDDFYNNDQVKTEITRIEKKVLNGEVSFFKAAEKLLEVYNADK